MTKIPIQERLCHYTHLTPFEREKILFFLAVGKSITEIAHLLSRSKSTISRELRRNAAPSKQSMPYYPLAAQARYRRHRAACRPHKRLENASLRSFVQMNSSFIAAMLTIVGYSINNTIIIFDRIRENARKMPSSTPRVDVVNRSIKECLGRTINTTLTTLVTIVSLYIFGVSSIREFALPIIVGIISGVYSANMINGYVWAFLEEKKRAKKAAKA